MSFNMHVLKGLKGLKVTVKRYVTVEDFPPLVMALQRQVKEPILDIYPPKCYLSLLPFELLAETLIYTQSVTAVLAVARTSRHFFTTLTRGNLANFIWRDARVNGIEGPIPDPTPNFTEYSYASFIFDIGLCNICQRSKVKAYKLHALGVKLCDEEECGKTFTAELSKLSEPGGRLLYQPLIESLKLLEIEFGINEADGSVPVRRRVGIDGVVSEPKAGEISKLMVVTISSIDSLSLRLHEWGSLHESNSYDVKKYNIRMANQFAAVAGWEAADLLSTPSHTRLRLSKLRTLQPISHSDHVDILPQVEIELRRIWERRKRRQEEAEYQRRRNDVRTHYEHLKSTVAEPLPNLATFRQIPIIKLLQTKTSSTGKGIDKSEAAVDILRINITRLREQAREDISRILGLSWKDTIGYTLHPSDRITSWFQCQYCKKVAGDRHCTTSLSFAGAFGHECSKKQKAWNAEQFALDNKASAAASKVLECVGISAEDPVSVSAVADLGARIMCLSCEGPIVMTFRGMICHCHRHDSMLLTVLSKEIASSMHTVHEGLALALMSGGHLRNERKLACRHCLPKIPTVPLPAEAGIQGPYITDGSTQDNPTLQEPQNSQRPTLHNLFTFNGMRSHLRDKHGIYDVGDEDLFCPNGKPWKT